MHEHSDNSKRAMQAQRLYYNKGHKEVSLRRMGLWHCSVQIGWGIKPKA